MLQVLYQDEFLVAIHKPPGMLVHRTRISEDTDFVLQRLRDQLRQRVYPVHRLDRPTAGLLLFALDSGTANSLMQTFAGRQVGKTYLAIVRGFLPESGQVDYPLAKDGQGERQPAVTDYICLDTAEVPVAVGRYPQSRYSLVEVQPRTGRMHQIRRHFSHLRHPIVGDRKHGDLHHNRMFREQWGLPGLQLLAWKMSLKHPVTDRELHLQTSPEPVMVQAMYKIGWEKWVKSLFEDGQPL